MVISFQPTSTQFLVGRNIAVYAGPDLALCRKNVVRSTVRSVMLLLFDFICKLFSRIRNIMKSLLHCLK